MYKKEVRSKDDQIGNEEISFLKNQLYVEHVEVTVEPSRNCEHNKSSQQENKNVENTEVKLLQIICRKQIICT